METDTIQYVDDPAEADVHEYDLPLRTEDDLRDFVWDAFGLHIPDKQICKEHVSPWRAFADAYFAKHPGDVWKASRGFGGKTSLLGVLASTEAVTLAADVNVLGGSGEQSRRVLGAIDRCWSNRFAPRQMLLESTLKTELRLRNGSTIRALIASQASVRGPHPARLRLDEIDEMDRAIFDAALGQPMGCNGVKSHIVASSTEQYVDGTMAYARQLGEEKGWGFYEWCFEETREPHGWLPNAEIALKQRQVPASLWQVEYVGQRADESAYVLPRECVDRMFNKDLGTFRGDDHVYVEIEPPCTSGRYAHGADWAKERDFTDIWTLRYDVAPVRLVAYQRTQRKRWPEMTALLDERIARYGGHAKHDATGVGDVVDDILRETADGVWLGGHDRAELFSNYLVAIERGEIICPWIDCIEREHRKATRKHLFGSGHPPDSIVAGALAWAVVAQYRPIGKIEITVPRFARDFAARYDW